MKSIHKGVGTRYRAWLAKAVGFLALCGLGAGIAQQAGAQALDNIGEWSEEAPMTAHSGKENYFFISTIGTGYGTIEWTERYGESGDRPWSCYGFCGPYAKDDPNKDLVFKIKDLSEDSIFSGWTSGPCAGSKEEICRVKKNELSAEYTIITAEFTATHNLDIKHLFTFLNNNGKGYMINGMDFTLNGRGTIIASTNGKEFTCTNVDSQSSANGCRVPFISPSPKVNIQTIPDKGSVFRGWLFAPKECGEAKTTCDFQLTEDTVLMPIFEKQSSERKLTIHESQRYCNT